MTIVTKPKTEAKPLVKHEVESGECVVVDPKATAAVGYEDEAWVPAGGRCNLSTATTACLTITVLLITGIGVFGGVYLYLQFSAHERTHFRGWCGIPYDRDELMRHTSLSRKGYPSIYSGRLGIYKDYDTSQEDETDESAEWLPRNMFKEELELDLESNNYEEISVPDFGFRHRGKFVHDFVANKTGIIDLTARRCYVMPLDRAHVLPPRSLDDIIQKMQMGYYKVDTHVVRETMHVVGAPVKDYESLGVYISNYCSSYPTYKLESFYLHDMKKRSVDAINSELEDSVQLAEFAGRNIVHYIILDNEEGSQ